MIGGRSDPSELFDRPIAELLATGDAHVFAEAAKQLQANDSHTVEVAFRLRIERTSTVSDGEDDESEGQEVALYQEMEGKGMLMQDRQSGLPSHTMWVFKPIGSPEPEAELQGDAIKTARTVEDPTAGIAAVSAISMEPLLCRICERDIPAWFFEKHSEICNEVHRLEMEIAECNEHLSEMRRTVKAVVATLEESPPVSQPEYRDILISTPPASSNPPSALEGLNRSLSPKRPNAASVRKMHMRALDGMIEILQCAVEISTPAIKEEAAAEPIEKQRLLSPASENKVLQVHQWRKSPVDDAALDMMAADVEASMRSKLSAVNRMLNTIVYVETVRQEWEERVEAALAALSEGEESADAEPGSEDGGSSQEALEDEEEDEEARADQDVANDDGEIEGEVLTGDPSGMLLERDEREEIPAPQSAALSAGGAQAEEDDIPAVEAEMGGSRAISPGDPAGIPIPRSQVSAHAVAHAPSPQESTGVSATSGSQRDVVTRTRRSSRLPSQDKNLLQTPPLSPRHSPSDVLPHGPRRFSVSHRSPLVGSIPLSPRLPPTAPSSRPTASSIKDFDIIKPISKGAFGSVFLTKKRATGDYYAIKVLKKSDMIAKNQITNVKAERMILMGQTQSPFVVKLYFTFQSADYLYLVMEYLPGGDCASLVKTIGGLPEEWAKQYMAEVVNGLEHLHQRGVVHR